METKLTTFKPLLALWNKEAFEEVTGVFQRIDVLEDFSYRDKEYKRIHFVLNEKHYLCASLSIGYPYGSEEKPSIFANLGIYEDDHWTSYFDGAVLPTYLDKAKNIQQLIPTILQAIKEENEQKQYGDVFIRDFSNQAIERAEGMTETQRKTEVHLYNKFHSAQKERCNAHLSFCF